MENSSSRILFRRVVLVSVIAVIFIVACCLFALVVLPRVYGDFKNAADVGSAFGVVGSLFSGLAFVGLIVTIVFQSYQIQISHAEMAMQRELGSEQRADQTIGRLLEYYRQNLDAIKLRGKVGCSDQFYSGVSALSVLLKQFDDAWKLRPTEFYGDETYKIAALQEYFADAFSSSLGTQSRYLKTLQTLLEYIERDVQDPVRKEMYFELVGRQLTVVELKYVFYHALAWGDNPGFVEIVVRSKILHDNFGAVVLHSFIEKMGKEKLGIDFDSAWALRRKNRVQRRLINKKFRKKALSSHFNKIENEKSNMGEVLDTCGLEVENSSEL